MTASHWRFERTRAAPDKRGSFFVSRTTQQGAIFTFLDASLCAPCAVRSRVHIAHNAAGRDFLFLNVSLCAPCAVRSRVHIAHNAAGREFLFLNVSLCAPRAVRSRVYIPHNAAGRELISFPPLLSALCAPE
jgi:hypothetical protein